MKVVFIGTPDFAAVSLKHLLADPLFSIVGVVTQPDRPKGRGQKMAMPPVKELAKAFGIEVLQPEKVSDPAFVSLLAKYKPDVIVVVAFGQKIPKEILDMPPLGCINVHGSLLPKYRGASPIHRAIMNGESETGITTMYMSEGWDEGDIIYLSRVKIGPDETVGELHDRLAEEGGKLLVKTLHDLHDGIAPRIPQNHAEATYAPKLKPEETIINWSASSRQIHNQVRGMNPWPVAKTSINGLHLKIWAVQPDEHNTGEKSGQIIEKSKNVLKVACGLGTVNILELQPENGKRMRIGDFLQGYPLEKGQIFGE